MTENDYQILLDVIEPLAGEWLADNPQVSDEAIVSLLAQTLQSLLHGSSTRKKRRKLCEIM